MAPLPIDQVKVKVSDIWPALAVANVDDPTLPIALDLPYRRWRIAFYDEKQSRKVRVGGQMRLCQFMLAIASLCLDERNAVLSTECMETT